MKRDSSPPEAIRSSGPNGAPGLVETSNSTRSRPVADGAASAMAVRKRADRALSGASSPATARPGAQRRLCGRRSAPPRPRHKPARALASAASATRSAHRPPRSRRASPQLLVERRQRVGSTRCLRASALIRTGGLPPRRAGRDRRPGPRPRGRALPRPSPPRSRRDRAPPAPRPAADARRRSVRAGARPGAQSRCRPPIPGTRRRSAPGSSPSRAPACIGRPQLGQPVSSSPACGARRPSLVDGMREPVAVALRGLGFRRGPPRPPSSEGAQAAARPPRRCRPRRSGHKLEQSAVAARIEQPAIVMLAVDLDQPGAELALQRGRRPADR